MIKENQDQRPLRFLKKNHVWNRLEAGDRSFSSGREELNLAHTLTSRSSL